MAAVFRTIFLGAVIVLALLDWTVVAQQSGKGSLRGRVTDESGSVVAGATIDLTDAEGRKKQTITNDEGSYVFSGLVEGRYLVRASWSGFTPYESSIEIRAPGNEVLNIVLKIAIVEQKVTVTSERSLSTDPDNSADSIVLRGQALDALPDDPDDLAAALQALAGPSAGPSGGEILVDGFSGTRLPPKNTIREVRINQNPFSAENDRLGARSVEIFTKPGTERFGGQGYFNFTDESLNSRNPFASHRAPFQMRQTGASLSGPLVTNKTSFYVDFEQRDIADNALVNATVLDPDLNIVPFNTTIVTPLRRTSISPRVDYQINNRNTLIARYNHLSATSENAGVGDFSLPERAFNTSTTERSVQVTETAVLSKRMINETRLQFIHRDRELNGDNSEPTTRVLDAFTSGGAEVGRSSGSENRWELQNNTSWVVGVHSLKAGARVRYVRLVDVAPQNFGGTFTFAGGLVPKLDAQNEVVLDPQGQPVLESLSSIEVFQRTRQLQSLMFSPAEIVRRGGGATQFTLAAGEPEASVKQFDFGGFIQDDWRVRRTFTLSLGVRYERQSNVHNNFDFAPRLRFGWALGTRRGKEPKLVIRGGIGIFYDRINEALTLDADRFDGQQQQQFVVSDSVLLGAYPFVPSVEALKGFSAPQTIRQLAGDLRSPYTIQSAAGFDKQLPRKFTLSVTFLNLRTLHALRSRNINAPVKGVRPFGDPTNIFAYESSGIRKQRQLIVLVNNQFDRRFTIFARYILSRVNSDTDGPGMFPANSYDLRSEYGPSSLDIRHRFFFGGLIGLPWDVRVNPFVVINSGRPFNIVTGQDGNGDTLFTDRPALATDLSKPGVVRTPFGTFDPNPEPGQQIIARNFGRGPAFLTTMLRVSRTFGLVHLSDAAPSSDEDNTTKSTSRYYLTVSVQVLNLFNRNNPGLPIGNLSSPFFGRATSTASILSGETGSAAAGNRRVEAQINFTF